MEYSKKVLKYYLDSNFYFGEYLSWFFDLYGHIESCFDEAGNQYEFTTSVAAKILQAKNSERGFYFENDPQWLYKYFFVPYSDKQLFAIVLGAWYGLDEKACRLIANRGRSDFEWCILNCFLCGMTYEEISAVLNDKSKSVFERRRFLNQVEYQGNCEISIMGETVLAKKEGKYLISCAGGDRYKEWDPNDENIPSQEEHE